MKPGALFQALAMVIIALQAIAPLRAEGERVRGCMSPNQARDVLIAEKLVAPFRALGEAARMGQGEAVGLQLCLLGNDFVYDVTLLRRDGRVLHTLVNARNGAVTLAPRNAGD